MSNNIEFVQTRCSKLRQTTGDHLQVVTYESRKPKIKQSKEDKKEIKPEKVNVWNIKKARHEVIRFGMSGFDPEKKEEAKVTLAIKLGAKPPKNKYKNYKQLKEEKKKEQINEKKRLEFQQLGKNQQGRSTAVGKFFKRKNKTGKLLDKYGKVTPKDIPKTKKSKR